MKRLLPLLALSLALTGAGMAEDLTLPADVIMRGDRSLTSIKAGTAVEVLSRDEKTVTIRYNGQTGTIPADSLVAPTPTPTLAMSAFPKPPPAVGTTPSLTIGSMRFYRVSLPTASPIPLREYIPTGETLEHWEHMASVRSFKDLSDPSHYLQTVAAGIAKNNPPGRSRMFQNDQTHDLVLDFVVFTPPAAPQQIAEWNLMRARYVEGRGLVVYKYAVRFYAYGADTGAKITAERNAMMAPFALAAFNEE